MVVYPVEDTEVVLPVEKDVDIPVNVVRVALVPDVRNVVEVVEVLVRVVREVVAVVELLVRVVRDVVVLMDAADVFCELTEVGVCTVDALPVVETVAVLWLPAEDEAEDCGGVSDCWLPGVPLLPLCSEIEAVAVVVTVSPVLTAVRSVLPGTVLSVAVVVTSGITVTSGSLGWTGGFSMPPKCRKAAAIMTTIHAAAV